MQTSEHTFSRTAPHLDGSTSSSNKPSSHSPPHRPGEQTALRTSSPSEKQPPTMSQSVLQLERYFISKVQIEAVQKTSFPAEIGSSTKLEVARNNQEPNKYVVSLTVAIAGSDQKPPPYVGEVQV